MYGVRSYGFGGGLNPLDKIFRDYKKLTKEDVEWEDYFDAINDTQGILVTGINFEPIKGLYKMSAGEEDNLEAVYDLMGVSKSYRPKNKEKDKEPKSITLRLFGEDD